MLKTLKLTNFRKHRDLTVNFTPGLNVFRAANEEGKSSILEAIRYAMGGSRYMRQSLGEVVTWGEPENSLRVELDFDIDGVNCNIVRKASGAELEYGETKVTGQTAVKDFVERLLNCPMDRASKLMIANQKDIQGSLEGGEAGALIEALADLSVIENLIDSVQVKLPYGNTKLLDSKILTLETVSITVPDEPSKDGVLTAQGDLDRASTHIEKLKASRDVYAPKVVAANAELARAAEVRKRHDSAIFAAAAAETALRATKPVVWDYSEEEVKLARTEASERKALTRLYENYNTDFLAIDYAWESEKPLPDWVKELKGMISETERDSRKCRETQIKAESLLIKETACGLCQKDLTDVPEVVEKNKRLEAEIETAVAMQAKLRTVLEAHAEELADCEELIRLSNKRRSQGSPEFWDWSDAWPPVATWKGAIPVNPVDLKTEAEAIAIEKSYNASVNAQAVLNERKAQLDKAEAAVNALEAVPDTVESEKLLAEVGWLEADIAKAELALVEARVGLREAELLLESEGRARLTALAQKSKAAEELDEAKTTVAAMERHNEIIRKLRTARPEVSRQLWNTVLGTVSFYFTEFRGEPSVVTRDAKGFQVNGKPADSLSGSGGDVLGLAIRVALVKTFLPNISMLILDEPFSACDENREQTGANLLASLGFEQTLLVTHSDAADALASNIITL